MAQTMAQTTGICIEQVSFSYGQRDVLNTVNLVLERGHSYALIGKSGSGKSTLLNVIAGFAKPRRGTVTIHGEPVMKPRRETAFLFQELGLFPWQTVAEAVAMPLKIRNRQNKMSKRAIDDAVKALLKDLKLDGHQHNYPHELSGGERQRVALARTLAGEPDLLLMDEPTSALDAMTREELQVLIVNEQRKRRATLLFVTHDIEEAVMLGQHILVMTGDGQVLPVDNPYYGLPNAREELGFYDHCITLRKMLRMDA